MTTRKPKPAPKPTEQQPPAKVTVELTAEDWQHTMNMVQVGAKQMIDNIVAKANTLTETIQSSLLPPEKP